MIVYIIMVLISIVFLMLAQKSNNKWRKILCYIIAGIPFFVVSAFRYNVGTDYLIRYTYDFNTMVKGVDIPNLEIGFKLLVKMIIMFTKNPLPVFIVSSGIIVGLIMATICSKSKNMIISVLIFFLGGFFFDSLNIMRQYISISIILFAYRFLLSENKKEKIFYIVAVLIASTFHSTSLIMLVLLVLDKKMLLKPKYVLSVVAIVLLLNERLFSLIGIFVQNTRFNVYLEGKLAVGDISLVLIIENIILYLGMYYVYAKNNKLKDIKKEDILFLNIEAMTLLIIALGAIHILFLRIAFYFSIFQILSVPYFISKLNVKELVEDMEKITKNKLKLIKKLQPRITILITVFIISIFTVHFIRTYIFKDTNEVTPYRTVFAKNVEIY